MKQALYQGPVIQQLCQLAAACVRCGPRGNVMRNEFKRGGSAAVMRLLATVYEDQSTAATAGPDESDAVTLHFVEDAKGALADVTGLDEEE